MRLKPDKYHPRKLFQLNGDGKPYKPIDEKKELLIAAVSFVAGIVFVTLHINRVSLLGLPGTLLSLIYIFSGPICCGVFFLTLIFHFSDVRNLKVRKSYYPDRIIYYIETPTLYDVDKEGVVAKIPVPRKVLETLEEEELSGIEIVRKVKEIKYYQNQAENTLDHIKNLPTITETSVLIDDYQHVRQWYLKKAAEAEKWVADTLLKRAETKEENEKRVEGIENAVKKQPMF